MKNVFRIAGRYVVLMLKLLADLLLVLCHDFDRRPKKDCYIVSHQTSGVQTRG